MNRKVLSFSAFPFLFMLLCLAVFLFVMLPMIGRQTGWRDRRDDRPFQEETALDILNERLANGEIEKAEYEEKRRLISNGWRAASGL